eukprot:GFUD01013290.1.p1 GENE.GFUD01013290.1~~GFUD01013290.1.p1  ORF type:complete len:251 (+),score=54.92 GFUD01013290.1:111-755(+)
MGTRMYGDFATDAKKKSQRKKSKKSTSGKLGVRFCGSQRFSLTNDSFELFDKYIGRRADEMELRKLLEKFFTNSGELRRSVIKKVLHQICQMKKCLLDLDEYRFYSSSILIIYEGMLRGDKSSSSNFSFTENSMDCENFMEMESLGSEECESVKHTHVEENSLVKIKMIDFANVSFPTLHNDQVMHEGPDRGFLMGLDSLYEILESLVEEDIFQ